MIVKNPKFEISAVSPKQYPKQNLPEIVLVGKSNVGKSSFINTMINRKRLARTSSEPGKTRQINFYNIDEKFIAGDTKIVLEDLIYKKGIIADIVIFDPPRKGLDNNSINNILKIKPKKIVYISCNPATLIRDLALFEKLYEVKTIIPVDMFPFTKHVECCALLCLK